jgi:hypothetical protein
MIRTMTVLLVAAAISGCTNYGKLIQTNIPNTCDGTGHSITWIKYGDSHVGALALTNIGRKSEWWFKLQPDNPGGGNYSDKIVTISAKPGGTPQPWLSISGAYSTGSVLVLCVPDTLPIGTTIDYMIEVEDVGLLDPRAEVVK